MKLDREFPSSSSTSTIHYDGNDNEECHKQIDNAIIERILVKDNNDKRDREASLQPARIERILMKDDEDKRNREASIQPLPNDGKLFHSFL